MRNLLGFFFNTDIFINTEYRLAEWNTLIGSGATDIYGTPVRLHAEAGFTRDWCGRVKGLQTAVTLRPVRDGEEPTTVNGVLYALYGEDCDTVRKICLSSLKIPIECFNPLSWQSLPEVPFVYAVQPRVMQPADIHFPILQSFLDTTLKGYLEYGEDFAIEFLETTKGWSKYWINDRKLPRRPWIHEKDYQLLDELLARYPSENNMFTERKLEPEYARYFVEKGVNKDQVSDQDSVKLTSFVASGKLAKQPTNFIFGYGSLINAVSRFQTMPKSKDAIPVRISQECGYYRIWNFRGTTSKLTALGIQKADDPISGLAMNGVIYPVDCDDMSLCDQREAGYCRVEVPWELVTCLSWEKLPDAQKTNLWMYVPEKPEQPSIDYPILQSYVDVCITGCLEYGEEFAREFLETTLGWNQFWINDRLLPRRPWIHCPNYEDIDLLSAEYPSHENSFVHRKLAEEYAALFVAPEFSPEFDPKELIKKVREIYTDVACEPHGEFHFEMGRPLCERLGYPPEVLDQIPSQALDSFAGVGYHFGISEISEGETVLDLGSGSGTDIFYAAHAVSNAGSVMGIGMTDAQIDKSQRLSKENDFDNVTLKRGQLEHLPFENEQFDLVISNGVINLCPEKERVFEEVYRVLKHGGRMAISDIITGVKLSSNIVGNSDLWAACIGGAAHIDRYQDIIEAAGLKIKVIHNNDSYRFISDNAIAATEKYKIRSISLLAVKPGG